jgi:AraC family transcriptional regulator
MVQKPVADHKRVALEWSQRRGVVEATLLETASATAALIEVESYGVEEGEWYAEDVHYIDMCLTKRSQRSRGRFEGDSEYQTTGRIFLAPAGRRIRFQTSPSRQRTVGLFLSAASPGAEGAELSAADDALWQCLHIWSQSIRGPLRRIAEELRSPGVASALIVEGLSLVILGELSRLLHQRRPNLGASGGLASWRLALIEQMAQADQPPPSVAELAAACQTSARHLMRAFRNETGQTLGAYVGSAAMERAKRRLEETDMSIAAVGAQAGFSNPAAFSAAFRRHTGDKPSDFRAFARMASSGRAPSVVADWTADSGVRR